MREEAVQRLRFALVAVALGGVVAATACTALLPFDGRDEAIAALEGGARQDAPPPPPLCPGEGVECVPVAPSGWTGPVALYAGDPASAPACPRSFTSVVIAD